MAVNEKSKNLIRRLDHKKAIAIHEKINTVGSEPLYLICDDYSMSYYVKNCGNATPAYVTINEVLCHYFLNLWTIQTPSIALVDVNKDSLQKNYGDKHRPQFYERIAFGSQYFENAIDAVEFISINGKVDFNRYLIPINFSRIGLFDMWVENDDRGPDLKNLMIYEKGNKFDFLAIDHAFALRTGAYDTLINTEFIPTENNYILHSVFFDHMKPFLLVDKQLLLKEEQYFYLCIEKCKNAFSEIVEQLPENWGFTYKEKKLVSDFLFNEERNKLVFDEYRRLWE